MELIETTVKKTVERHGNDATRMLDIIRDVQAELGCVSDEAIDQIAKTMNVSRVDVDGVVTFYHFFSKEPVGKYAVYLNNSAVANMKGRAAVARAFEKSVGCAFGKTCEDKLIGLFDTSCIGMNDQEPAAIINGVVFTNLDTGKAENLVADMKSGKDVQDMIKEYGDGQNQSELIKAMVNNNIKKKGEVLFSGYETGSSLKKAVSMDPDKIIEDVKSSRLRGRGGAGFPTGMKWGFCREAQGQKHYVVCNADEGEPGTFKDRVILTEIPQMLFEGMAISGYAVGAEEGILYLRAEYFYLKEYLDDVLKNMRKNNVLGKNAGGKNGFNFDISIIMGAGAYVCGEESALIESAEGKRGEPRNRPPFPVQSGYLGYPTTVNNVETYCAATKILLNGADWFSSIGTVDSKGTKLLSISGDCDNAGIYEVEWGLTVTDVLHLCGGEGAQAVVVGGPSGTIVGNNEFLKRICFEELGTGGSIIIIGQDRDLLEIVHNFMDFFVEESCGWCVPCRSGNLILKHKLEKIINGNGTEGDIRELEDWCDIVKSMSRCGLGQTSPNPISTTIRNFRDVYDARVTKGVDFVSEFDLEAAVKDSCEAAGRKPNLEDH